MGIVSAYLPVSKATLFSVCYYAGYILSAKINWSFQWLSNLVAVGLAAGKGVINCSIMLHNSADRVGGISCGIKYQNLTIIVRL